MGCLTPDSGSINIVRRVKAHSLELVCGAHPTKIHAVCVTYACPERSRGNALRVMKFDFALDLGGICAYNVSTYRL